MKLAKPNNVAGKVGHARKIIRLNNLGVVGVNDKSLLPLKVKVRPVFTNRSQ